jgi:uncharacterized protein (DUF1015 family)
VKSYKLYGDKGLMAIIVPFRAIRYNPKKIEDISSVVAPPYDIIDEEGQKFYYKRHENNIIRLILGLDFPSDNEKENKYTRAANYLKTWQKEGILLRDPWPCFYLYHQEYRVKEGELKVRKGFIGLMRLEEFGSGIVYPHEDTFPKVKEDRFRLTLSTMAHFNPIFSLYYCPENKVNEFFYPVENREPEVTILDENGVIHRLWCVKDEKIIANVRREMEGKQVFIADGHNRYETALRVRDYFKDRTPDYTGWESFNFVMMYFSNMNDKGLTILPTHKLIFGIKDYDFSTFLNDLQGDFKIEIFPLIKGKEFECKNAFFKALSSRGAENNFTIGLFALGSDNFYLLKLKDPNILDREFGKEIPSALKTLDVTILHRLILEKRLGIGENELREASNVRYVRDEDVAVDMVKRGDAQLAFLVNPVHIDCIREVALSYNRMPQKSTYFYPKLLSGLVINPISTDEDYF